MDEEIREMLYKKHKCWFTKKLRRSMTPEENILWEELRGRRFKGTKFRRQVNIGPYIADFLCWRHYLIIEVDGGIHNGRKEYDAYRDDYLRDHKFRILRLKNEEVRNSLPSALQKIEHAVTPKTNT